MRPFLFCVLAGVLSAQTTTLDQQVALWNDIADQQAIMTRASSDMAAASAAYIKALGVHDAAKAKQAADVAQAKAICQSQAKTYVEGSIVCQ
jgi:hypothetical protein